MRAVRFSNIESAQLKVLTGKSYEATIALEFLAQKTKVPGYDFLFKAYQRRRQTIARLEVVDMLGKQRSSEAIKMLAQIARGSSVSLVRYYALRNLIECGVTLQEFLPERPYSSFWKSLLSYEEYRQDKISLDELRKRAAPHAEANDYNWYWLAHC